MPTTHWGLGTGLARTGTDTYTPITPTTAEPPRYDDDEPAKPTAATDTSPTRLSHSIPKS